MKIKIIQSKQKGRADSFFYEGEIATVKKPNGTVLSLSAEGDIRINIGDDCYRNGQVDEAVDKYNLTDKKLQQLEAKGNLEWENNNWFEVVWTKKGENIIHSDLGNVAHDYDEAIELLKSYYEDEEY